MNTHSISNIGILGGTLDPIQIGHTIIAQAALNELNLDKILFMPSGNPPHKDINNITSNFHRKNMVELAIKSNDRFVFSDFEMKEVYKTDNPISAKTVQQVTKADDTHVSYIGLYPNTIYNLYVCKQAPVSIPFTEVFTEHNLLYINQYESDSDGNLSIDYVPMQEATGAVEILVAQKRINITDNARVSMADIKYDGETHSPLIEYYFSDSLLSEGIDYEIEGDYEA